MPETMNPLHLALSNGYVADLQPFTQERLSDPLWRTCFGDDPEGYAYHLAFAESGVANFRSALLVLKQQETTVAAIPVFTTEYRLDTTVQGRWKSLAEWVRRYFPRLLGVRLLCVGSAVTDSARLGVVGEHAGKAEIARALVEALNALAIQEKIGLIAFKDVLERDREWLGSTLKTAGYNELANMPVARNPIRFKSLDEYFAGFSASARKDFRRKWRARNRIDIEEFDGMPPDIAEIHALYMNCYEKSELKFEQLTPAFFAGVGQLTAPGCRFVLYRENGQLIGFNLLLHRAGTLIDKYIGMDYDPARRANLYFVSWLHNIEMCIRDGLHTFQSGQGAYATKKRLGAELEMTWIYFRHRNPVLNLGFRALGRILAYANFDQSVSDAA